MATQNPFINQPDIATDLAALARRQKMAESLLRQSMTPSEGMQAGDIYVAPSMTQGLAKLLQAHLGRQELNQAEAEQRALVGAEQARNKADLSKMSEILMGQGGAPDIASAYRFAAGSDNPALQQFGLQGMAQIPSMEAHKQQIAESRAQRNQELEASRLERATMQAERLAEARNNMQFQAQQRKDMQDAQIKAQQDNARLVASLRQPQQPHIIQTDAGPMQMVNGQAVPILGPEGKPVKGANTDKPLTEFQGKSVMFGTRAANSNNILSQFEESVSPAKVALSRAGGMAVNWALPENELRVEQAQRDFINAVLRQESGAAIGKSEYQSAARQYFPQPNDPPELIKQKRLNRELVIKGFARQAGPGASDVNEVLQAGAPKIGGNSLPPVNSKGWKLFTDAKGNQAYVSPDGKSYEEAK